MQANHFTKTRKMLTLIQSSAFESPCHFSVFGDWGLEGCHGRGNPFSE